MSNPADHSFVYDKKTGHYVPPRTEMSALERLHVKENEIARLMTENILLRRALDQIAREGECVYARRIAQSALTGTPLASHHSAPQGE